MRRSDKKLDDREVVESLLIEEKIGRIGTCGPNGPMIKPVNFLYLNGDIYFHSSYEGEKMEHIKADPRVVFEIERDCRYLPAKNAPCEASFAYSCVIIRGRAELVEKPEEKIKIFTALMSKYQPEGGYGRFNEKMVKKTAVVKIVVESISGKTSPVK
ncbi:hypothetical protein MNBD_NITROSPINAE04-2221 [hydrothermal vent metagenome]|uniref:Pyridoxamine 5'-phosphate oxidase-related, FMN-binding n=1 Tax=hydrothermal vent metagenome TaxID=652676 RepID=A0A3B1CAR9_9ZZZZ